MATVIGPIGIQYTDLRHGRISLLIIVEIILNMFKIFECHGKSQRFVQRFQAAFVHISETIKNSNISGIIIHRDQSIRLLHAGLSGIYRVDTVRFDLGKFFVGHLSFDHISHSGTDHRFLVLF